MTVDETAVDDPAGAPPLAGRYSIGPEIGRGSTATVHRAHDAETGREVAIKLFDAAASALLDRHRREIDILTGLRHPGLVALLDAGSSDGHLFVVMDLVEGRSLEDALVEEPLAPSAVAGLGARLADALAHVHGRGVVHRDVKPANILLDRAGHPRLADFGIARLDGATRMTDTGVVVGTAAYMAPEQVRGATVGPPADVYSLGLVLLEALTGLREYPGAPVESAIARLHRPPTVPTGLPPALDRTLRRMTATDPARRPTAAELAGLLGGPATGPVPAVRRGRRLVPAAALGVLVAGVLGGWLLAQPGAEPVGTAAGTAELALLPPVPTPITAAPAAQPAVATAPAEAPAGHVPTGPAGGGLDPAPAAHNPAPAGPAAAPPAGPAKGPTEPAEDKRSGKGPGSGSGKGSGHGDDKGAPDDKGGGGKSGKG